MDLTNSIRAIVADEIRKTLSPHLSALQQLQRLMGAKLAGGVRRGRLANSVARAPRGEARGCAVIGCSNDAKSKGYCAAHYQKYRMLQKRGWAEQYGWSDGPAPQSVENPKLPRGRAAAKTATGEGGEPKARRGRAKKA